MTRENYFNLRNNLKQLALELKVQKQALKEAQRAMSKSRTGSNYHEVTSLEYSKRQYYREYRALHIFMCLLRGKTREQIENNFQDQSYYR